MPSNPLVASIRPSGENSASVTSPRDPSAASTDSPALRHVPQLRVIPRRRPAAGHPARTEPTCRRRRRVGRRATTPQRPAVAQLGAVLVEPDRQRLAVGAEGQVEPGAAKPRTPAHRAGPHVQQPQVAVDVRHAPGGRRRARTPSPVPVRRGQAAAGARGGRSPRRAAPPCRHRPSRRSHRPSGLNSTAAPAPSSIPGRSRRWRRVRASCRLTPPSGSPAATDPAGRTDRERRRVTGGS